jgi:DNA-binding NtrC family response regulator
MTTSRPLKIAVLDDSPFYSKYLAKQLESYEPYFSFEERPKLKAFLTADEFLDGLDADTQMAFIDFYLDHGQTAIDLLPKLRRVAPQCEVIVISQQPMAQSEVKNLDDASIGFILKDQNAAMRSRLILHDMVSKHLTNRLIGTD